MKKNTRDQKVRNEGKTWTVEELRSLRQQYTETTKSVGAIAELLGRTPAAIGIMAHKLGIRRTSTQSNSETPPWEESKQTPNQRYQSWSLEDDSLLRVQRQRKVPIKAIAAQLKRTPAAVQSRWNKIEKSVEPVETVETPEYAKSEEPKLMNTKSDDYQVAESPIDDMRPMLRLIGFSLETARTVIDLQRAKRALDVLVGTNNNTEELVHYEA